jgi:prophage antirepressor-like protein
MSLSNLIVNIYQNIININGSDILILTDNNNKIWFAFRQIIDILDYKNIRKEMKRIEIDKTEIITLEQLLDKIPKENKIDYTNKLQPTLKMISEAGLFILLNKSRKPYAEKLKTEIFTKVLPSIRKTGEYKVDKEDKLKLKKLTKKLQLIQKEQSMKKLTSKKYTDYKNTSGKGFIYILKVKTLRNGKEQQCYKIGYATNLNKRLETYKTGHPDIELVHQENVNVSKKQLEKCVLNLNIMKRLSSKNEIICDSSLKDIINEIQDCKKLIQKYSNKSNTKTKINNIIKK